MQSEAYKQGCCKGSQLAGIYVCLVHLLLARSKNAGIIDLHEGEKLKLLKRKSEALAKVMSFTQFLT